MLLKQAYSKILFHSVSNPTTLQKKTKKERGNRVSICQINRSVILNRSTSLSKNLKMAFYQLFHLILHEIDRFGCFMLKSGFFSKSLVLCLKKRKFHFFTRPRNDSACGHFPASFPHIVDTSSSIIPCV